MAGETSDLETATGHQLVQKAVDHTARKSDGALAFWLVVIMLGLLFALVVLLLVITWVAGPSATLVDKKPVVTGSKETAEFCKWALTTLLGAFGAWIGAGAAYFFGKENLAESSASTERALQIQQETMRGPSQDARIKDLRLLAINTEFMFQPTSTKEEVTQKLNKNPNYWWVPVMDAASNGTLHDVIHARVFWDQQFDGKLPLDKLITELDKKPDTAKLHGAAFFLRVTAGELLADVAAAMDKCGAVVGIVTDEKRKPTYCFTKQDLMSAQSK